MPRREPERASDKAGGKGRASPWSEWEHDHGSHARKRAHCKGHSLGIGAFEERITEALILALYLGELICQKYFLGANANQHPPVPGPQTGLRDTGRAEPQGKVEHNWERQENPSRSKQGGQKAAGMLPAQEGYVMHRGKGSVLPFHNRWAKATPGGDSAPPYLPQALTLGRILLERSQGLRGVIRGILPI